MKCVQRLRSVCESLRGVKHFKAPRSVDLLPSLVKFLHPVDLRRSRPLQDHVNRVLFLRKLSNSFCKRHSKLLHRQHVCYSKRVGIASHGHSWIKVHCRDPSLTFVMVEMGVIRILFHRLSRLSEDAIYIMGYQEVCRGMKCHTGWDSASLSCSSISLQELEPLITIESQGGTDVASQG